MIDVVRLTESEYRALALCEPNKLYIVRADDAPVPVSIL